MRPPSPQHGPRALHGFTLAEVLVSLFILVLGTVAATTLVSHLLRSTALSEEELVATNLAREGLEAFRNVRDSNWQANSGSQRDADAAREHWSDEFKEALETSAGTVFIPVLAGSGPKLAWHLFPVAGTRYADADGCAAVAGLPDMQGARIDEKRTQLYRDPATGRLTQACADAALVDAANRSRFRRELTVIFLDSTDPAEPATGTASDPDAAAKAKTVWIESKVSWYRVPDAANWDASTRIGEVRLQTILTDWFGRNEKGA